MLGCDSIETKIAIPKHQRQKNPSDPNPTFNPFAPIFVPRHALIRHEPGTSVYVRGLADEVCNCRLREVFQPYGSIVQAKVILLTKQLIIMLKLFLRNIFNFYVLTK